jgi:hypothetical protein
MLRIIIADEKWLIFKNRKQKTENRKLKTQNSKLKAES